MTETRSKLIAEIYDVVLQPERYDKFMALWENYIGEITPENHLQNLNDNNTLSKIDNDQELEEHFQRAFQILERMGRTQFQQNAPANFIDSKTIPACLINPDGEITHTNNLFRERVGPVETSSGLKSLVENSSWLHLRTAILGLKNTDPAALQRIFVMNQRSETNSQIANSALYFAQVISFEQQGQTFLYVSSLDVGWSPKVNELLRQTFGLTESEMDVAELLVGGNSINEISEHRDRSVHTLRTQVKALLSKTGSKSQSELVRTIATLAHFSTEQSTTKKMQKSHLAFGEQEVILLADGREMPIHIMGPEGGQPFIFIHGMLDGIAVAKAIEKKLHQLNLRMISPVRPSFDTSPPAYQVKTAPVEFASDLRQVLDAFGISKCPLIGHMAGSVYAFAAGGVLGDRISGIVCVSGGIPITSLSQFMSMSPRQKLIALTAKFTPKLLPAILRTGISQIDKGNEVDFMNALYMDGSHDRAVVENEVVRTTVYAGYRFAVAQGHKAFEVDSKHVTRNWSSYVSDYKKPAILLHGKHDPVVDIKSVESFAQSYPNVTLMEHAEAGQLLMYQDPEFVLQQVKNIIDGTSTPC